MRRFQFRLATVLRYRETVESLREQDFSTAKGHLAAAEIRLRRIQEEFARTLAARPGAVTGERFDAPAIFDRERYLETLTAAIAAQQRRAEAARVVVGEKRQALVAARQAREVVSRLQEKEIAAHTALISKMEQDALDELATLRHARAAMEADRLAARVPDHAQPDGIRRRAA